MMMQDWTNWKNWLRNHHYSRRQFLVPCWKLSFECPIWDTSLTVRRFLPLTKTHTRIYMV